MPDQNYNVGNGLSELVMDGQYATGAIVNTIDSIRGEWNHELTRKKRKRLAVDWPFMYRQIERLIKDE